MFPPRSRASEDAAVRSTDSDALLSRVSAARLGYFDDPYCLEFLTPSQRRSTERERRPPLINIGTHARTWGVDHLVEQFFAANSASERGGVQVLSLGAGTDTRFWRMRKRRRGEAGAGRDELQEWPCRKWLEIDFAEATGTKARTIASKPALSSQLGGDIKIEQGGLGLSSPLYAVLPGDLRDVQGGLASTILSHLDPTLPTLVLLECVLVYLAPEKTDEVLSFFSSTFKRGVAVSYDPFGLDDSFGEVMKRNLAMRGLSLPGSRSTGTLEALTKRLETNGFHGRASSLSIRQIRDSSIPRDELDRVGKIEQIDEVEELNLVLEHYAITWGHVNASEPAVLDLASS